MARRGIELTSHSTAVAIADADRWEEAHRIENDPSIADASEKASLLTMRLLRQESSRA